MLSTNNGETVARCQSSIAEKYGGMRYWEYYCDVIAVLLCSGDNIRNSASSSASASTSRTNWYLW